MWPPPVSGDWGAAAPPFSPGVPVASAGALPVPSPWEASAPCERFKDIRKFKSRKMVWRQV